MRRDPDGEFRPISSEQAMDEIAEQLRTILDRFGPNAIALYYGTMATSNSTTMALIDTFVEAIGTPLRFSPATVDKAGKNVAAALHGRWLAPSQGYTDPEVALLFGINPPISYQGAPRGNPAKWLSEWRRRGMKLIVVDPRRTDTARRADLHLQVAPGHDALVFAALINVVIGEGLHDAAFVTENVSGFDRLNAAVAPWTASRVAGIVGVDAEQLVTAARLFATAKRGYVSVGTGPNMSGPGTLIEYLALCLETICGRWLRAGEVVRNTPTLLPAPSYRAQASGPIPGYGLAPVLAGSGLSRSAAGMPIAGLPDEILLPDEERRVHALFSCGGNPASAWPDQHKVVDSLRHLDLLVQIDTVMSSTARLAKYVIAAKMPLETAGMTQVPLDTMSMLSNGYGLEAAFSQYSPQIVDPPAGSDLIEEWQFFAGLAARLGLPLTIKRQMQVALTPFELDPAHLPTTDELLERLAADARVPLDEVKAFPHGAHFPEPACVVAPKDPKCTDRLEVGDARMMADLAALVDPHAWSSSGDVGAATTRFPFRLVPRRVQHLFNSSHAHPKTDRGRPWNPAFMHPADLELLGLDAGDEVSVVSEVGRIDAIVLADPDLRQGLVSMTHCYGGLPDDADADYAKAGSSTSLLLTLSRVQPYTGQPVMSNVPVDVIRRHAKPEAVGEPQS